MPSCHVFCLHQWFMWSLCHVFCHHQWFMMPPCHVFCLHQWFLWPLCLALFLQVTYGLWTLEICISLWASHSNLCPLLACLHLFYPLLDKTEWMEIKCQTVKMKTPQTKGIYTYSTWLAVYILCWNWWLSQKEVAVFSHATTEWPSGKSGWNITVISCNCVISRQLQLICAL